jgi:hypothetical protein
LVVRRVSSVAVRRGSHGAPNGGSSNDFLINKTRAGDKPALSLSA